MTHRILRHAISAAMLCIAPAVAATDWPQFGFDAAHSGHNPLETTITPANVATLATAWGGPVALPAVVDSAPVYASGIATPTGTRDLLFAFGTEGIEDGFANTGVVFAIDAATGDLVWSSDPIEGTHHASASPAIDPNRQYVYGYGLDGFAHKYRIGDGVEITVGGWPQVITLKPSVEKSAGSLTIARSGGHDYLLVVTNGFDGDPGDYQGHVVSIDLASGVQNVFNVMCSDLPIHFVLEGIPGVNDCNLGGTSGYGAGQQGGIWGRGGATYDAATDRIYITSGNGDFTANGLGFEWGDSVLALAPDGTGNGIGMPWDSYTPENYDELYNQDMDFGSMSLAILPAPAGSAIPHLGLQGGKDGLLRLLNLDDMSGAGAPAHVGGELQLMPAPQGAPFSYMKEQPAVWVDDEGTTWVFVANFKGLSGLTLTLDQDDLPLLETQWSLPNTSKSPVVANGLVFTADGECHSDTCNLVARDARTGALLWSSPFLDELHWQSPILVDGALYITDSNGLMWKFGLPDNDAIFGDGFEGG